MAYWLLKADPDDYGFEHLQKEGRTVWDGVSNPLALKHMRAARKGDQAFLYHSGREKAVVGIAEVLSDPFPDPRSDDERRVVLEVRASRLLKQPVTLANIRGDSRFADFPLVRMPRLSVMPVPPVLWKRVLAMAGEKT